MGWLELNANARRMDATFTQRAIASTGASPPSFPRRSTITSFSWPAVVGSVGASLRISSPFCLENVGSLRYPISGEIARYEGGSRISRQIGDELGTPVVKPRRTDGQPFP